MLALEHVSLQGKLTQCINMQGMLTHETCKHLGYAGMKGREYARPIGTRAHSMQDILGCEQVSIQDMLVLEHISMQGTLVHEHASMQGMMACEYISA